MSVENTKVQTAKCICEVAGAERLQREFEHLRSDWCWLLAYGVFLTVCGAVAIVTGGAGRAAAVRGMRTEL